MTNFHFAFLSGKKAALRPHAPGYYGTNNSASYVKSWYDRYVGTIDPTASMTAFEMQELAIHTSLMNALTSVGSDVAKAAFESLTEDGSNVGATAVVDMVFNHLEDASTLSFLNSRLLRDQEIAADQPGANPKVFDPKWCLERMMKWHFTAAGVFVLDFPKVLETKEGLADTPFNTALLECYKEAKRAAILKSVELIQAKNGMNEPGGAREFPLLDDPAEPTLSRLMGKLQGNNLPFQRPALQPTAEDLNLSITGTQAVEIGHRDLKARDDAVGIINYLYQAPMQSGQAGAASEQARDLPPSAADTELDEILGKPEAEPPADPASASAEAAAESIRTLLNAQAAALIAEITARNDPEANRFVDDVLAVLRSLNRRAQNPNAGPFSNLLKQKTIVQDRFPPEEFYRIKMDDRRQIEELGWGGPFPGLDLRTSKIGGYIKHVPGDVLDKLSATWLAAACAQPQKVRIVEQPIEDGHNPNSVFFPDTKTVYSDNASVLTSCLTAKACVEAEKVGQRVWSEHSGLTNPDEAPAPQPPGDASQTPPDEQ